MLRRNGFKHVFNFKWRLKSFAAGRKEGRFVCSEPCPVWKDATEVQRAFLVSLGTALKWQTPGFGTSWQAFFIFKHYISFLSEVWHLQHQQSPAVAQGTVLCAPLCTQCL